MSPARRVVTLPPSLRGADALRFAAEARSRGADVLELRTDLHARRGRGRRGARAECCRCSSPSVGRPCLRRGWPPRGGWIGTSCTRASWPRPPGSCWPRTTPSGRCPPRRPCACGTWRCPAGRAGEARGAAGRGVPARICGAAGDPGAPASPFRRGAGHRARDGARGAARARRARPAQRARLRRRSAAIGRRPRGSACSRMPSGRSGAPHSVPEGAAAAGDPGDLDRALALASHPPPALRPHRPPRGRAGRGARGRPAAALPRLRRHQPLQDPARPAHRLAARRHQHARAPRRPLGVLQHRHRRALARSSNGWMPGRPSCSETAAPPRRSGPWPPRLGCQLRFLRRAGHLRAPRAGLASGPGPIGSTPPDALRFEGARVAVIAYGAPGAPHRRGDHPPRGHAVAPRRGLVHRPGPPAAQPSGRPRHEHLRHALPRSPPSARATAPRSAPSSTAAPPACRSTREQIQAALDRRRPGQSALTTAARRARSGGDPLRRLRGQDARHAHRGHRAQPRTSAPRTTTKLKTEDRPGHADAVWRERFKHRDHRGGGRTSGRETLCRVIGGAVAEALPRPGASRS